VISPRAISSNNNEREIERGGKLNYASLPQRKEIMWTKRGGDGREIGGWGVKLIYNRGREGPQKCLEKTNGA